MNRPVKARRLRRGSIYALVLIVASFVVLVGLSSMTMSRVALRRDALFRDQSSARLTAVSGAEYAVSRAQKLIEQAAISGDDWRGYLGPSYTSSTILLGDGQFIWKAEDATGDGDLTDDPLDPVLVTVKGESGGSAYAVSYVMEPVEGSDPMECIQHQLHVAGHTQVAAPLRGAGRFRSNSTVDASAEVNLDVEAAGAVTGGPYLGTTASFAAPFQMPLPGTIDTFVSLGTPIDVNDLPFEWGKRMMSGGVLSPGHNPFGDGATNPYGIYVLDSKYQTVEVRDLRVVGTLILLNPNSWCQFAGSICWEPAVPGLPSLLVDGPIEFRIDSNQPLDETAGESLNPGHTPFQGVSDPDLDDEYPSVIKGLVYVTGDLDVEAELIIEGPLVVGGQLRINSALTMIDDASTRSDPPTRFRSFDGAMAPRPGSFCRVIE